jgi:hypothetical protein
VSARTQVRRDLDRHAADGLARAAQSDPGSVMVGWCDGGEWAACFGLSLMHLYLADASRPDPRILRAADQPFFYLRDLAGSMGIASARNHIAQTFLDETAAEWLFMVDADMGFEPTIVEQLITAAESGDEGGRFDVMGALAFALKRRLLRPNPLSAELSRLQPTVYDFAQLEGGETGFVPRFQYERDAVQPCAATGAAAVLISREILLKIRARYGGSKWFEQITHPTGAPDGGPRTFSEDLSFCVRVAAVGGRLGVDTRVKTAHAKGGLFLTEEQYDIQRAVDEGARYAAALAEAEREGVPA